MENKKRLIDANALLELVQFRLPIDNQNAEVIAGCVDITRRLIEKAPTVDAVEVVRCKDCKHWHEETGWCDQHSWFIEEDGEPCHPWESNNWKMFDADYFCAEGERKDNG